MFNFDWAALSESLNANPPTITQVESGPHYHECKGCTRLYSCDNDFRHKQCHACTEAAERKAEREDLQRAIEETRR